MVRIGGSTDRGAHIKETDYYTPQGEFRVDRDGSPTLLNCLMYKMCYYRFGSVYTEAGAYSVNILGDYSVDMVFKASYMDIFKVIVDIPQSNLP